MSDYKKKLIEVALQLEAINKESAREKSIRHGHPSTLHLWWARRPLAAARAVIWSSLVDAPSPHPEEFPTEEAQNAERQRLFKILEDLVVWENSNNEDVLNAAKAEIMKSTDGNPPPLLDPFAGGGAIPLEAQRLGLEAHASDLNPVAVMINKAMIEIPPKFAGQKPVNPETKAKTDYNGEWKGASGLAEDVRYYGEWMKQKAFEKIGHLYPKVKDESGKEHTVIAWIWARTVKCPNPACGCEMPLASSFVLSKKKEREAYVQPIIEGKNIRYEVRYGKNAPESVKLARGAKFKCIKCGDAATPEYIKYESSSNNMGSVLMAIVAKSKNGRLYFSPDKIQTDIAEIEKPNQYPTGELFEDRRAIWTPTYGLDTIDKLFTNRQLFALCTFSDLVFEAQKQVEADIKSTNIKFDIIAIDEDYVRECGNSIGVYLALLVDKLADSNNSLCPWEPVAQCPRQLFARQGIPMIWDFAEANPLGSSSGSWQTLLAIQTGYFSGGCFNFQRDKIGVSIQNNAQSDIGLRDIIVSTDPPYYDNIGYADLSDFFYVWLSYSLKKSYPDLFKTLLVPKVEELTAIPYRFDGRIDKARTFFEDGMYSTCKLLCEYTSINYPVTIFYAYKQSEP
jgi:putative DNA methylase